MFDNTSSFFIDDRLLNLGSGTDSRWSNLGYWGAVNSYPAAAAQLAEQLGGAAQLLATDRVLDIGFGRGDQLFLWLEKFGVRQLVGQEIMLPYVEIARQRIRQRGLESQVMLQWGSATALGQFKTASFDKILSLDSAYHFQPRREFFRQAWRLLNPGGRLALTDIVLSDRFPSWLQPIILPPLCQLSAIPRQNLGDRSTYRQQLLTAGFINLRLQPIEEQIFSGFARFMGRQAGRYGWQHPSRGWVKLLATGLGGAIETQTKWLHYLLVTAEKPDYSFTQGSSASRKPSPMR